MENEIYIVDGQQFNVHPSQKDEFLKKYPNAELQNATPAIRNTRLEQYPVVFDETTTKNTRLELPNIVVDPQEKMKRSDFNVSFGGPGAIPSMPFNIRTGLRGGSGILNFLGNVPEFLKGATELIVKTKVNSFPSAPLFGNLTTIPVIGEHVTVSEFNGQFKDGEKNGKGHYKWFDLAEYNGDWKDDKKRGKGIYTFADGDKYVGDW